MKLSLSILAAVGALALTLLLVGCGGARPAAVVEAACEAARRHDVDAYWKHYSKEVQRLVAELNKGDMGKKTVTDIDDCSVGRETIEGDRAVVEVDSSGMDALLLKKEEGKWVIYGARSEGRDIDMEKTLGAVAKMMKGLDGLGESLGAAMGKAAEELTKALGDRK